MVSPDSYCASHITQHGSIVSPLSARRRPSLPAYPFAPRADMHARSREVHVGRQPKGSGKGRESNPRVRPPSDLRRHRCQPWLGLLGSAIGVGDMGASWNDVSLGIFLNEARRGGGARRWSWRPLA